tara:strand:- start:13 stop:402 length:390 start_codon:yes stop_codon:yes gene_type:complete
MGNISSINKVNFEELQIIQNNYNINNTIIINTLHSNNQDCLILNTLSAINEEETINSLLKKNKKIKIIIYGKNYYDEKIYKKYTQLNNLGFKNIYIYIGGMFEWLCLQEIYGKELFKTTIIEKDILKYK